MRKNGKLFYGGVPTAPDVEKLMSLNVEPGSVIDYETIERLVSLDRKESRFRTVTKAWRDKLLRECRLRLIAEGDSFRVLTPDETVSENIRGMHRVGRAAGREVRRVEMTDTVHLSEPALKQHMLLQRSSRALLAAAQDACEKIAAPPPVHSWRRLGPPPVTNDEDTAR